ncbi:MAG: glycosyltransferase [Coriobacteriia bacterium]|nr:glycosyltransferase [Coriobacteriia bacterium]
MDARARKQAAALTDAGAHVTMVGIGTTVSPDLIESGYDVRLIDPPVPKLPRLGHEDIWWPLRVAVNLTYTRIRERRFLARQSSFVHPYEPELYEAAIATRPDIIHAYNSHTLSAAIRVKRKTGARVVYDSRDLFTDVEYLDEAARQEHRNVEEELICEADAVITVCEPRADILESRYAIPRPIVVYNGPAEVMTSPSPIHEPVRLLFQGALQQDRNLAALAEAAGFLRGRVTLTMQGFGGVGNELRTRVAELGLDDVVTFVPPASPLQIVKSAWEHDVGVICHKADSLNHRSTVPNKLMDYLGAGLALAASDLPGHRSVLEGTGAAVFIDPSSSETIAEGLSQLVADPVRIAQMKRAALETAERYAWPVQAERLIEVYESVIATGEVRL